MSTDSADRPSQAASRERLSALMDGELDDAAVMLACAGWRDEAEARASWHAYQLIGDVLRSEDLASSARRDAEFLGAIRSRLAAEPVVLAPPAGRASEAPAGLPAQQVMGARRSARRSWMAPSAVAAGFVAIAGAVLLTRGPAPALLADPGANLAQATAPVNSAGAMTASLQDLWLPSAEPRVLTANGKLIRDARLDRYLAAHQQFAGTSALGVPSAFLRSATADASNR